MKFFNYTASFSSLAGALLLTGCASVTRIDALPGQRNVLGEEVIETIHVENTDWKLLCLLPIASGDPDHPNEVGCRWFRDTTCLENQMKMINAEMKRVGAVRATEIITYENEEDVYLLLLLRRKIHTSAVLSKTASPR